MHLYVFMSRNKVQEFIFFTQSPRNHKHCKKINNPLHKRGWKSETQLRRRGASPGVVVVHVQQVCVQQKPTPGEEAAGGQRAKVGARARALWHLKVHGHLLWVDHQSVLWHPAQQDPTQKDQLIIIELLKIQPCVMWLQIYFYSIWTCEIIIFLLFFLLLEMILSRSWDNKTFPKDEQILQPQPDHC